MRNSVVNFCERMLSEHAKNASPLHDLDALKAKAAAVFDEELSQEPLIALPSYADIIAAENATITQKKIIGTGDVDVAALIDKLANSDWVKSGIGYLERSKPQCPFCQQEMDADLSLRIAGYFNETYERDIAQLDLVSLNYGGAADTYLSALDALCEGPSRYLDKDAVRSLADRAHARLQMNRQSLARKRAEPSTVITLEDNSALFGEIEIALAEANTKAEAHNAMIADHANQKQILTSEIWKFMVEESKGLLDAYEASTTAYDRAVNALNASIQERTNLMDQADQALRELERGITSVEPTVSEINALLQSFGFRGFRLATAGDRKNLYEIHRLDGSDAARTLSEGEKTFIAFLYFYHLIRGSQSSSGITEDRIIVFDDPVSSLDSDVLFIVSSLIKRVFDLCRSGQLIKQVFFLTHNIYFHKEVSFNPRRTDPARCLNEESFWIVRKRDDVSAIENHPTNPIKTSYELLWNEVKDENRSRMTIQNTLRRILENYFKILGNLDKDDICERFDGRDKIICNSLFSWVNDGSHNAHDDLYLSADQGVVESYLDVFRRIFEQTGHNAHYQMMMGTTASEFANDEALPPGEAPQVA